MKINKRYATIGILLVLILLLFNSFYFQPANAISQGAGTILTPNWYSALTWINNNTEQCAVVATYWDPGHFITAIAQRAVVFDGASQGAQRTVPTPLDDGLHIERYDKDINRIVSVKDGNADRKSTR